MTREFTDLEAIKSVDFDKLEPDASGGSSKIYFFNIGEKKYCLKKQTTRESCKREWDALQKLASNPMSPNPVSTFTQSIATPTPFCIVTEWAPGILLGDFLLMLSRNSRMNMPSRKAHIFWRGILRSLEGFVDSMHELGLSHNDFYLHNVLVSMDAGRPKLTVLDYGNVTRVGERCETKAANIAGGHPGESDYDYYTLSVMGFWMHQAQGASLSSVNDMTDSVAERDAFLLSASFDSAVAIRINLFTTDPMKRFQAPKAAANARVVRNRVPSASLKKEPDSPEKPVIPPIIATAPKKAAKSKPMRKESLKPADRIIYWVASLPIVQGSDYSPSLFLLDLWSGINIALAALAGLSIGVAKNDARMFSLSIIGGLAVLSMIAIPTLALRQSGEDARLWKKIHAGHLSLLSALTLVAAFVQANGKIPTPRYILSAEVLSAAAICALWAAISFLDCRVYKSAHRSQLLGKILIAANACSLALSLAASILA